MVASEDGVVLAKFAEEFFKRNFRLMPAGERGLSLVPIHELAEWLNKMMQDWYEVDLHYFQPTTNYELSVVVQFQFESKKDAMLFKLAWT